MKNKVQAFIMIWEDAYGRQHQTLPLSKDAADISLASMWPHQHAYLMMVLIDA